MVRSIVQVILVLSIISQIIPDGECGKHGTALLNQLLNNYQLLDRPVKNESETLRISFGLTLMQIYDLYEREGILKTLLWESLEWNDYNLRWNPSDYGNITDLRIPPHRIWKPDIYIYNSVSEEFDGTYHTNAVVLSNGSITYIPPGVHQTNCKMEYTNFPFDEHNCSIKFGSWTSDGGSIDLQLNSEDGMDISSYIKHPEWELLGAPGRRNAVYYACCPDPYIDIEFTVRIKRRGGTILSDAKRSSTFTIFTLFLSFFIPASSGHKISFAILHLICVWYTVWSLTSKVPHLIESSTDGGGPLINYFQVFKVLSEITLGGNVFLFWIYRQIQPMPEWLQKYVVDKLDKVPLLITKRRRSDALVLQAAGEEVQNENTGSLKNSEGNWQNLANTFDRICLVVFTTIACIIWLAMFPSAQ